MAEIKVIGDIGAGTQLGRYELLAPIASGGMAMVWAARLKGKRGFQKLVAIKTIRSEISEDPQFEQMFLDEASIAARIRHPHVVEVLDLGEELKTLFIVMEWIDGEPLHTLMKHAAKQGGIPRPIAVRIATQLCAGLHAAHELRDDSGKLFGVVHRDVSPQNVLVTYDGVAKLVDFGIAKAQGRTNETQAGQIKGKASYMAPEQARGGVVDRRTDVFALGILLYAMTTGKHPFRRETDAATLLNICSDAHAYRPSKLVPDYPANLEAVVMQAIEKDPAKRFPTANDMVRALDRALPAAMRASTDEEVASFVRGVLGDARQKRQGAIRAALLVSDERAGELRPEDALGPAETISPELTPISAVTSSLPMNRPAGIAGPRPRPAVETSTSLTPAGTGSGVGPSLLKPTGSDRLLAPPELSRISTSRKTSPATWIAVAALVVAVVAVVGMFVAFRTHSEPAPEASAPPRPSAVPAANTVEATAPATDAVPPAASARPADTEPSAEPPAPPATQPEVKHEVKPASTAGAGPTAPATKPPPAGPPATTKRLPQVRDPGF